MYPFGPAAPSNEIYIPVANTSMAANLGMWRVPLRRCIHTIEPRGAHPEGAGGGIPDTRLAPHGKDAIREKPRYEAIISAALVECYLSPARRAGLNGMASCPREGNPCPSHRSSRTGHELPQHDDESGPAPRSRKSLELQGHGGSHDIIPWSVYVV